MSTWRALKSFWEYRRIPGRGSGCVVCGWIRCGPEALALVWWKTFLDTVDVVLEIKKRWLEAGYVLLGRFLHSRNVVGCIVLINFGWLLDGVS
jgi:hypothetical protein